MIFAGLIFSAEPGRFSIIWIFGANHFNKPTQEDVVILFTNRLRPEASRIEFPNKFVLTPFNKHKPLSYPEAYSSSEQTIHWDSLGGFGNVVDRRQWSLINFRLLTLLLSCSAALMLCSPRAFSWSRRCLALSQRHRESLCWNCSRLISQVPGLTINSSSSDLYSSSCSAALVFSDGSRALSRSCRCLALSQRHRGPYHQQELSYQVRCRPRVSLPWELEPLQTPQIPSTYEASVVRIESHGVVWVFSFSSSEDHTNLSQRKTYRVCRRLYCWRTSLQHRVYQKK